MNLQNLTALKAGEMIRNKEISVEELALLVYDRIMETNEKYHAYVEIEDKDAIIARAREVQKGIDEGLYTSPLAGVPMAIKDNICSEALHTTCASKILKDFKSPYNSTVVEKLLANGAIIMGKLNMDEFAMGSTTETSCYGITRNPWNENHVPGGSSGGSATAVALKSAIYTLGSDTGGSVRQPCSFCSTSGIKPTYGAVSRFGLIAYGSSLDQIGPIASDIKDVKAISKMIYGYDAKDNTSLKLDEMKMDVNPEAVKGKKIAIPQNYFGEGINPEVKAAIENAAKTYESLGATVEYIDMPMVDYAVPAYYIIASAEASSNLSRFDGVRYGYRPDDVKDLEDLYLTARSEGFGSEVKRRIMLGAFVLSSGYYDAYYQKALKVKALILKAFKDIFAEYDMILMPVAPTTAPKIGESLKNPLQMYLSDIYTVSINIAGVPSVSIPCGFSNEGLPIGMQLVGDTMSDEMLLDVAAAYQEVTDFHSKVPGGVF